MRALTSPRSLPTAAAVWGEMRDAINKNYNRYLMKEAAELRTAQVREVVEEHFRTTAGILEEMAGEFSLYEHFDEEAAQRVEDILRDNGVTPLRYAAALTNSTV